MDADAVADEEDTEIGGCGWRMFIKNRGYEAPLAIGKWYRVIHDRDAESHGYLRIVDESGEDYVMPQTASSRSTCRNP